MVFLLRVQPPRNTSHGWETKNKPLHGVSGVLKCPGRGEMRGCPLGSPPPLATPCTQELALVPVTRESVAAARRPCGNPPGAGGLDETRGVLQGCGCDVLFPFPSWPRANPKAAGRACPRPSRVCGAPGEVRRGGAASRTRRWRRAAAGWVPEDTFGLPLTIALRSRDGQALGVWLRAVCVRGGWPPHHQSQCVTNPCSPPFILTAPSHWTFFHSVNILAKDSM